MSGTTGGGITSLGGSSYKFTLDITDLVQNVNTAEQAVQTAVNRITAVLQTIDPAAKLAAAGIKDLSSAVRSVNTSSSTMATRMGTLNTRLAEVGQRSNNAAGNMQQIATAAQNTSQATATITSAIQAMTAALRANAQAAQQSTRALTTMQQQAQAAQQSAASATTATAGGAHGGGIGAQLGGAVMGGLGFGVGLEAAHLAVKGVEEVVGELKAGVIDFNQTIEHGTVMLAGWVGGMDNAKAAMAQIVQNAQGATFGSFDIESLTKGEAALQRLGEANDRVRKQVADVAAGTGRDYAEMALQLGRLNETAEKGGPVFNREVTQLERAGIITSEWADKIRNAQKEGASLADIQALIAQSLDHYNGAADRAGNSLAGLQQRGETAFKALAAEAGKPIFDGIEAGLKRLNAGMQTDTARNIAQGVAYFIQEVGNLINAAYHGILTLKDMAVLAGLAIYKSLTDAVAAAYEGLAKFGSGLGMQNPMQQQFAATAAGLRNESARIGDEMKKTAAEGLNDLNTGVKAYDQVVNDKFVPAGKKAAEGITSGANSVDVSAAFRKIGDTSAAGFIEGMNKQQLGALNALSSFAEGAIYGQAGKKGFDPTNMVTDIRNQLPGLIAGSQEAAEKVKAIAPPEVYDQIMRYVAALNSAQSATKNAASAAQTLADARANLTTVTDQATEANKAAADAVKGAQDAASEHAAGYDQRIQSMREASDAGKQQAQDAREARQSDIAAQQGGINALKQADADAKERRQAGIQGLQDEAEAEKAVQTERMRQIDAQVTAAQVAQEHAQALMRQHTEMLTAIEQGQADQYIAEVGQIDDVSQRMYDRYAKEMGLLLDLKRAKDDAARQGHNAEDARVLQYEEQIHSAYNSGNVQQARLLERSEQRYKSQADFNNQLTDQRAKVAGENVTDVQTTMQREGQAQTAEDKGAEANAKRQLQAVGDVKAAQAAADRVTNQAQAERIKSAQESDKQATQAATDRQRIVERQIKASQDADKAANIAATDHQRIVDAEIKAVENDKRTVGIADKQALGDAQNHATIVKNEWQDKVDKAKELTTAAQAAETAAKGQETAANGLVTTMQAMTQELRKWAEQFLPQIVDQAKALADLAKQPHAQGGVGDANADDSGNTRGRPAPQAGPAPSQGARAGGGPVMAGGGITVGEFGAETFIPKSAGFIIPSDLTAKLMGGAPRVPDGGGGGTRTIIQAPVSVSFPNLTIREEADLQKIGAVIARSMNDAATMARRQGTPSPGYLGG